MILKPAIFITAAAFSILCSASAQTAEQGFGKGPIFEDFGPAASVDSELPIPENMTLRVAFDIVAEAEEGKINRAFESVARFMNMHAAAGVPQGQIRPAIVVHGPAASDLLLADAAGEVSPTAKLVEALLAEDVLIYLCGQTAAAREIEKDDLIPGVQIALSAMTAHAVLANQGYSLNPF